MSTPTQTEAATFKLAALEVKKSAGGLTRDELLHRKSLQVNGVAPRHTLTLGGRVVTGHRYHQFAGKALNAAKNGRVVPITENVTLADLNGGETKTLLRVGSATSVGAFQSLDPSREYAPTRRPLDLLDLVRLGTTDEGAVPYMRQTTYTPAAVEVAEAVSPATGTKPEGTLPFEQIVSPVESIPSWVPVTTRALADVDEMRGIIDEQLLYDARRRLEAQLLAGNGTPPNLRGSTTPQAS